MRSLLASTSILVLTIGAHAQVGPSALPPGPLPVRAECAVPPSTFNHIWYFDPVNGLPPNYLVVAGKPDQIIMAPITVPAGQTMKANIATKTKGVWAQVLTSFVAGQTIPAGGIGSQEHPWSDLSAVAWSNNNYKAGYKYPLLASVPTYQLNPAHTAYDFYTGDQPGEVQQAGPIRPGDEILLMSGNYGSVIFNLSRLEVVNNDWITVAPAPGQSPVIGSLNIADTNMWHFDGIKIQGGNGVSLSDGGGNGLTTHDIVFSHLDLASADDSVSQTWTQAEWASKAGGSLGGSGSNYGQNTYCIGLFASHSHNVHQGPSLGVWHSTLAYNESERFLDNSFSMSGSYNDIFHNFSHDPVDSGQHLHVDGYQQEGWPLQPGDTTQTYTQIHFNGNLLIDHYDPTSPFPTIAMTGIDDYSGQTNIIIDHLLVENNVWISSGTCFLYANNIQHAIVRNNTCVPAKSTQYPYAAMAIGGGNSHDDDVYNNISTEIDVSLSATQPNVTFHDNIAVRYVYQLQNADGSFQTRSVFAQAPGWWGPAGRGPYSATGSDGTPLTGNNNQVVSRVNFLALFQQAPNQTVPPSYDLSLVPGVLQRGGRNLGAGRRFTVPPQTGRSR